MTHTSSPACLAHLDDPLGEMARRRAHLLLRILVRAILPLPYFELLGGEPRQFQQKREERIIDGTVEGLDCDSSRPKYRSDLSPMRGWLRLVAS